jgi:hypothetical protein
MRVRPKKKCAAVCACGTATVEVGGVRRAMVVMARKRQGLAGEAHAG